MHVRMSTMNHNPPRSFPVRMRVAAAVAASLCAGMATADVVNPWGLGVYTSGNIGTASSGFSGQVSRGMMSGGSTYVNNISIGIVTGFGPSSGTSIFADREVILSGWAQGGIDAGSHVTIKGGSTGGGVQSGGSLKSAGSGGNINGNVTLGGTNQAGNSVSVNGTVLQSQAYAASANIAGYGEYFRAIASQASSAASTGTATSSGSGDQLSIATSGTGTQYVNITGTALSNARNVSVSAGQDATVVVNVSGDAANFTNMGWSFSGGASAARTIFVFENASSVSVSGSVQASILANSALVQLASGSVSGSIVGMGLIGNGSVGSTQFTGLVPAPGAGALACAAAALCFRRKRS